MAADPRTLTVTAGEVTLEALVWGPVRGPLALCLHGFPDTAWTWRHLAPGLAGAGWRVVAPFLRGYAPSGLAPSGDYSASAYAADAVALHAALAGDERAVLIGHDWGAVATYIVAGGPQPVFARAVTLSVPPLASFTDPGGLRAAPVAALRQLGLSSYVAYLGFGGRLAERSLPRLVPWLWRRWSPGYDPSADLPAVLAALSSPESRRAARLPYRALPSLIRAPAPAPRIPLLYLHGEDDHCMHAGFARLAAGPLGPGRFALIPGAGHFLPLEAPEAVADRIEEFLGGEV
jgi:pimeloyl-ACP methyl ester carboxylesterase